MAATECHLFKTSSHRRRSKAHVMLGTCRFNAFPAGMAIFLVLLCHRQRNLDNHPELYHLRGGSQDFDCSSHTAKVGLAFIKQ
jgi:hypothetical protein